MLSYAKINLCLDVVSKRDDGYHELDTIMHRVELFDEINCEPSDEIEITTDSPLLQDAQQNICYKACKLYGCGARIDIKKNIPMGAGMGGGSSNGATVLRFLNAHHKRYSEPEMMEMSRMLGADVPFFYAGKFCQRARGIGEKLEELPRLPRCYIVIVKPFCSINTGQLFGTVDFGEEFPRPAVGEMVRGLHEGDLGKVCKQMMNSLEVFASGAVAFILDYKRILEAHGALAACMTGSGTAVFGIFTQPPGERLLSEFSGAEMCKCLKA